MTEHHSIHSGTVPAAEVPLDQLLREHGTYARKLQAEAVAESLTAVWRLLGRAIRTSAGWIAERHRRAATERALIACSDRTLADIGIPRDLIHLAARGVNLREHAVSEAGWWARTGGSIRRMRETRREQLRTYRELASYSDRELEEIGVRRGDLAEISRAA